MPTVVDPKLTPSEIRVYAAIRDALGQGLSPTLRELSERTGMSIGTISAGMTMLKNRGHSVKPRYRTRCIALVDPDRSVVKEALAPWEEDLDTPLT